MTKTPEQIVADFVKHHKLAERNLHNAYAASLKMAKGVEDGIKAGMVRGLDAKSFIWKHREAVGKIAEAAAFLADLHKDGTAIAQTNGVDLGSLDSVGGVTIPVPEFSVMDGGR